jgi:Na+-transporting methylmalonyl-CoA/oxaloacetate decarboxylase gamma subunit
MEGRSVKSRTQKILVTGLTALITSALGRLFANTFTKEVPPPEQRTLADDTKEAVSHAVASVIAVVIASAIVRWIAGGSQA